MLALCTLNDSKVAQKNKLTKFCDMSRSISCHGNRCHGNWKKLFFLNVVTKNRNMEILCAHIKEWVKLHYPKTSPFKLSNYFVA